MTRTKAYPGLVRPPPSHISEIIRDDHPHDPEYPTLEELSGEDLLILDDLRSHREKVERLRKEDEDQSRLLLAGMLRKEETSSRLELLDFARGLGIEVVADNEGTGTTRTRKLKELEKEKWVSLCRVAFPWGWLIIVWLQGETHVCGAWHQRGKEIEKDEENLDLRDRDGTPLGISIESYRWRWSDILRQRRFGARRRRTRNIATRAGYRVSFPLLLSLKPG